MNMKKLAAMAAGVLVATMGVSYGSLAEDNAGNYNPGDPFDGLNEGSGFLAWDQTTGGVGGNYIGATELGDPSFGIWSGGVGADNWIVMRRDFDDFSMSAGDTLSFDFAHTIIFEDNPAAQVGFTIYSDGDDAMSFWADRQDDNWGAWLGGTDFRTDVERVEDTTMNFSFTYDGGSEFSWSVGGQSWTGWEADNDIDEIDGIAFFSRHQGDGMNTGFDNIEVVPEPGTMALLGLGLLGLIGLRRRMK